jgi:hypothetical protein
VGKPCIFKANTAVYDDEQQHSASSKQKNAIKVLMMQHVRCGLMPGAVLLVVDISYGYPNNPPFPLFSTFSFQSASYATCLILFHGPKFVNGRLSD